jgi:hypothetical protein
MARFKYAVNLQNLARCVGLTCHDGLLAPGMWDRAWRTPRGVGHPETHPHSQAVVVYAEYSSSTLTPGLQLCKECIVTTALPNNGLLAPREARNLGIGRKPMKLVVVSQWVRARKAQVPPD